MYIKSVRLEHIGCFQDETFEFGMPSETGHWISILGNNGTGKTTLLRAIAMGMCGETSASALLRELYSDFVSYGSNKGTITITFSRLRSKKEYVVETTVSRDESGHTEVKQKCQPRSFAPWQEVFVTAYGANRSSYKFQDIVEYSAVDSVYSLFNYDSPLQHPELIFRRMPRSQRNRLMRAIDQLVSLPGGSTRLTPHGIVYSLDNSEEVILAGWGDGHRVSYAMLSDVFAWAALFDQEMLENGIEGIVIIDEFENHLHPSLQLRLVPLLAQRFTGIQFITTTHSALCTIATTELADKDTDIYLLPDHCDERVHRVERPPRGLRADQVLTSHLFGLDTSGDNQTKREVEQYAKLAGLKQPTAKQNRELKRLAKTLDSKLGSGETRLEREIANGVKQYLASKRVGKDFDPQAIDFELRRQLADLLGDGE